MSIFTQGIYNPFMLFSITTEIILILLAGYLQPFNIAFGMRDNVFKHYGIPIIPFAILLLVYNETRKLLCRTLPADKNGKPHWFVRASFW